MQSSMEGIEFEFIPNIENQGRKETKYEFHSHISDDN